MIRICRARNRLLAWSVLCVSAILVVLILQAGTRGTYAAELSPERRDALNSLARAFSDATVRPDGDRAYALLSNRRKETMSRDQFDDTLRAKLATFSVWEERPVWIELADPAQMPEWYGVPEGIDPPSMQAWVVVTVGIEKSPPEGIAPRPCDLYLLVVADEGGLRIGEFDFAWCD